MKSAYKEIFNSYPDVVNAKQLSEMLHICLLYTSLSERDRDLLVYCYFFDLDQKKVAEIMDIKPANIRMAIHRARKRALKLLKKEGDNDDNI